MVALTQFVSADDITGSNVENIYYVAPGIYRSGQPTKEGFAELEKNGLKSVLNLRSYNSDDDEAEGTSLNLYRIKMNAGHIKDDDVIEALKILKDSPKPLLIHCWHGSDRTGTIVAMYRIIFEDWDREVAIQELLQPRYGHHKVIYVNIPIYIRNVDVEKIRAAVFE